MKKRYENKNGICGRRRFQNSFFVILLLFCLVLFGCSKEKEPMSQEKNKDKINIVLLHGWGTMSKEDVVMRQIYQDFEKENPDVKLSLVSMPSFESLEEKAKDMLAIGNIPNIIYTGVGGTDTLYNFMVEQDSAVDLMPYLLEDEQFQSNVSPYILKRWTTQEQKLYTVSDLLDIKGYWYNKKIFANAGVTEVPNTWKDFMEACRKIKEWSAEKKYNTVVMDFDAKKSAVLLQAILPEPEGSTAFYPLGSNSFSFLQNLSLFKRIYQENDIRAVEDVYKEPLFSFRFGHSAIYIGEIWEAREFSEHLDADYALFPNRSGKQETQISAGSGYLISNWGSKEQQEASVRFIKYMLSYPVQMKILWETGRIPSNPRIDMEVLKNTKSKLYFAYQKALESEIQKETPENSWNGYVYRKYISQVQRYLHGDIDEKRLIQYMADREKNIR